MKRLLFALVTLASTSAHAFTNVYYLPSSTGTVMQGTLYVASGTVSNLRTGILMATGPVTMGSAGFTTSIGSTTIMQGATFYDLGTIISSVTVSSITVTPSFHGAYVMLSSSQSYITTSSATSVNNTWVNTNQRITLQTPRLGTLSEYRITAFGTVEESAAGNDCWITIFRGPTGAYNGGSNLGAASGGLAAVLMATITDERVPISISVYDSPGSASATTYTVAIKAESGTCTWNSGGGNSVMIIDEYGNQPGVIP